MGCGDGAGLNDAQRAKGDIDPDIRACASTICRELKLTIGSKISYSDVGAVELDWRTLNMLEFFALDGDGLGPVVEEGPESKEARLRFLKEVSIVAPGAVEGDRESESDELSFPNI